MCAPAVPRSLLTSLLTLGLCAAAASPAWAVFPGRDGSIVFQAQTGDHTQLYTVRPDGRDLRQITSGDNDSVYAEWSPDGRKIIFELDTPDSVQIELMNPDGSEMVDISPGSGCCYGQPSFTPDGRHVVYEHYDPVTNEDSVEIMNADGSRPRKLLEPWPGTGGATDPIVSPDGRLLSVIGDDGSTKGPPPALEDANGLFVSRIDGSGFTQLMPFTSDQSLKHDWSPDGRLLLVSTNANWYDPTQSTNIATIRPDGRDLQYLTDDQGGQNADNAFAGSYSPSGRWIVFRQEDHGRYALERMRPDGSGARIILPFSTTLLPRSSDWGAQPRRGDADL